jgi:hypothetical protein
MPRVGAVHQVWPGYLDRGTAHEGVVGVARPTAAATPMLWRGVGIRRYRQWSVWGGCARACTDDYGSPLGHKGTHQVCLQKKGVDLRAYAPRVHTK